jgi:putative DNA primase/helicase
MLHGAAVGPPALGSFERWSNRIRNPLIWLGMADPCISQKQIRQNDTKLEAQTGLLKILHRCFPDVPFKAREILSLPMQQYQASLIEHLNTLGCYTKGTIDVTRVGRILKKMDGRIIADLLLKQAGRSGGTVSWVVGKT